MALSDNIVLLAHFQDDLIDGSGNQNDGSFQGSGEYFSSDAKLGTKSGYSAQQSYHFKYNDDATLNFGAGAFSVSFWIKKDTTATGEQFISKYNTGTNRGWYIANAVGNLRFHTNDGSTTDDLQPAVSLSQGVWYHIVCTRSSSGVKKVYLDNSFLDSSTHNVDTDDPSDLLACASATYNGFVGKIDEFILWNKELTTGEISSLYNSGNGLQINYFASAIPVVNIISLGNEAIMYPPSMSVDMSMQAPVQAMTINASTANVNVDVQAICQQDMVSSIMDINASTATPALSHINAPTMAMTFGTGTVFVAPTPVDPMSIEFSGTAAKFYTINVEPFTLNVDRGIFGLSYDWTTVVRVFDTAVGKQNADEVKNYYTPPAIKNPANVRVITPKPYRGHQSFIDMMRTTATRPYSSHSEGKKPYLIGSGMDYGDMEEFDNENFQLENPGGPQPTPPQGTAPEEDPCGGNRSLWAYGDPTTIECGKPANFYIYYSDDFVSPRIELLRPSEHPNIEVGSDNKPRIDLECGTDGGIITFAVIDDLCGGFSTVDFFLEDCPVDCSGVGGVEGETALERGLSYQYVRTNARGRQTWGVSGTDLTIDDEGLLTVGQNACGNGVVSATDKCCGTTATLDIYVSADSGWLLTDVEECYSGDPVPPVPTFNYQDRPWASEGGILYYYLYALYTASELDSTKCTICYMWSSCQDGANIYCGHCGTANCGSCGIVPGLGAIDNVCVCDPSVVYLPITYRKSTYTWSCL